MSKVFKMRMIVLAMLVVMFSGAAKADMKYLESGPGSSFDGCEYSKLINLKNGYVWECMEYDYEYHFGDMTVIEMNGDAKLCLGDVDEAIEEYPNGDCFDGRLHSF